MVKPDTGGDLVAYNNIHNSLHHKTHQTRYLFTHYSHGIIQAALADLSQSSPPTGQAHGVCLSVTFLWWNQPRDWKLRLRIAYIHGSLHFKSRFGQVLRRWILHSRLPFYILGDEHDPPFLLFLVLLLLLQLPVPLVNCPHMHNGLPSFWKKKNTLNLPW